MSRNWQTTEQPANIQLVSEIYCFTFPLALRDILALPFERARFASGEGGRNKDTPRPPLHIIATGAGVGVGGDVAISIYTYI